MSRRWKAHNKYDFFFPFPFGFAVVKVIFKVPSNDIFTLMQNDLIYLFSVRCQLEHAMKINHFTIDEEKKKIEVFIVSTFYDELFLLWQKFIFYFASNHIVTAMRKILCQNVTDASKFDFRSFFFCSAVYFICRW